MVEIEAGVGLKGKGMVRVRQREVLKLWRNWSMKNPLIERTCLHESWVSQGVTGCQDPGERTPILQGHGGWTPFILQRSVSLYIDTA